METSLATVIDLYAIPTGRRIYALGKVMAIAEAQNNTDLILHCQSAISLDRGCLALERRWAGVRASAKAKPTPPPKKDSSQSSTKLDNLVDRTLGAIRDHAVSQAAGALPDDPIHAVVTTFLKRIFPSGVADVTNLPYIEELAAVEDILADLKSAELAPIVEDLGLGRLVKRLDELAVQYRVALHAPPTETTEFAEVRAARAEGQERLLQAVALIIGAHFSGSPEHVAARNELLSPILEQNAAVAAALRHRRALPDVNPDTGADEPEAVPAEPAPPAVVEATQSAVG